MAGSPRYLDLMATYAHINRPPNVMDKAITYSMLKGAWEGIEETKGRDPSVLKIAAVSALYCLMAEDPTLNIEQMIEDAKRLHIAKNAGYAGASNPDPWANFRMCQAFGISALDGVLVRLSDKYIRIRNLREDPNNERVGESLIDTLRDYFAYCNIGVCIAEESQP